LLHLTFPEHALEDRVDVLEVITEVELFVDLGIIKILFHLGVFFQQRPEIAFAEECEISRSCQSTTFSIAGVT
jgi:hypothetical protein